MVKTEQKNWLTIPEAAELAGQSESWMRNEARRQIDAVKNGFKSAFMVRQYRKGAWWKIERESFLAWLEAA